MTAFRMPLSDLLPPRADFWARFVGDLAQDEALIFHVGHVIYGLTLGAWVDSNR
jgi:hypothetical protein